jgi:hypothetical protein
MTFGGAAVAQQSQQQEQQQKQPQQQQQPEQNEQQKPSGAPQAQSMTFTGCVYQATDQPTMFALQRAEGMTGTSGTSSSGSTAGSSGAGAGTAGSTSGSASSTAGTREQGAWYRLSPSATQDLKQYVGQMVRISGSVTPGRDEKGADVVIHRIEPERVTVTAVDLKPAPQLQIQSITQAQGECSQGSANR